MVLTTTTTTTLTTRGRSGTTTKANANNITTLKKRPRTNVAGVPTTGGSTFLLFLGLVVVVLFTNRSIIFPTSNAGSNIFSSSSYGDFRELLLTYNNAAAPALGTTGTTTPQTKAKTSKLGDGCYHVFLDVGSNIGNHVRFLFESQLYPKATIAKRFFDDAFGTENSGDENSGDGGGNSDNNSRNNDNNHNSRNRNVCVFSFEPNPDHITRHKQLQNAYHQKGWKYYPINAGVGHQYGNLTFYRKF